MKDESDSIFKSAVKYPQIVLLLASLLLNNCGEDKNELGSISISLEVPDLPAEAECSAFLFSSDSIRDSECPIGPDSLLDFYQQHQDSFFASETLVNTESLRFNGEFTAIPRGKYLVLAACSVGESVESMACKTIYHDSGVDSSCSLVASSTADGDCEISLEFGVGHAYCAVDHVTELIATANTKSGNPVADGSTISVLLHEGYFVDHDVDAIDISTTSGRASDWVYCGAEYCTRSVSVNATASIKCSNGTTRTANAQVFCQCESGDPTVILNTDTEEISLQDQSATITGQFLGPDGNRPSESVSVELSSNLGIFPDYDGATAELTTDQSGSFSLEFAGDGEAGTAIIEAVAYLDCIVAQGYIDIEISP